MGNIQNGRNRPSKIRTLSAAFLLLSGATAFASDVATIADSPYQGKKLIISMQYDWEPLSFKDDSGNPTGYFYDIATEAAKRLGQRSRSRRAILPPSSPPFSPANSIPL